MDKYLKHSKTRRFKNLVLIAEDKKTIQKNRKVSNVYTFSHAHFEYVEFYVVRQYVNLKQEGR